MAFDFIANMQNNVVRFALQKYAFFLIRQKDLVTRLRKSGFHLRSHIGLRVQEQFGEQRIESNLHGRKPAEDHLENIKRKVGEFVGDAPQSDDLTMLFIHYLPQTQHLVLHNDVSQISRLPAFMDGVARMAGLEPSLKSRLNLALEEAVSNVILYAYPKGTDGLVDIDAVLDGKSLIFTVSDGGKPFDPTGQAEVDIHADVRDRKIGGLGIHLVREIMDTVRYERKGDRNILTMTKNT